MTGLQDSVHTILLYGDSNTYGYDPRGFGGGRYPESVRWTDRLKRMTEGKWRILVNAMNGREIPSGAGMDRALMMIRTAVEEQQLDGLAVMLGTNDLFSEMRGQAALRTAQKMDGFLEEVSAAFPELPVLLMAPPKIGSAGSGDPVMARVYRESRQLALYYQLLAERRGLSCASAWSWDLPLAADEVHLTEEAQAVFAEEMYHVLEEWEACFSEREETDEKNTDRH